jgi:hypothetical protein
MSNPEVPDQKQYVAKVDVRVPSVAYLVRNLGKEVRRSALTLHANAIQSRVYSPSLTWYVGNPKSETIEGRGSFWINYKSDPTTSLELRISGARRAHEGLYITGGIVQIEPITIEDDEEFNDVFTNGSFVDLKALNLSRRELGRDVFEGNLNLLTLDVPK